MERGSLAYIKVNCLVCDEKNEQVEVGYGLDESVRWKLIHILLKRAKILGFADVGSIFDRKAELELRVVVVE